MALKFQQLKVVRVDRETSDAITIHFDNTSQYSYLPGQYLTLKVEIDGKGYNRAYSLCSSPVCDNDLAVTVKKVDDGLVSSYLNNTLKEGTYINVVPPLGNFSAKLDKGNRKHYILIGAGSGITPLMSILRSVLEVEQGSRITLLYGNRTEESIIFKNTLSSLETQYPDRVKVYHSLSQAGEGWAGQKGRLSRGKVKELLQTLLSQDALEQEFFVCGPSAMMDEAMHGLKELNIPANKVHQEHFSAPLTHPLEDEKPVEEGIKEYTIKVILDDEEREISVSPSTSILEAALDNDLDPPYACMIGSCCTCKAKLLSGKVIMDDREGLTDDEIAEGYVLTCQSHPTSTGVVVSYDEV